MNWRRVKMTATRFQLFREKHLNLRGLKHENPSSTALVDATKVALIQNGELNNHFPNAKALSSGNRLTVSLWC